MTGKVFRFKGRGETVAEDNLPQHKNMLHAMASALRAIGELGPQWISAIAGLIATLTTAGFIVGHATGSRTVIASATVVTVTKTVQVQVPDSRDNASVSSSGAAGSNDGVADGTQLGSYSIDLTSGYSVPLTATQPSQDTFILDSDQGDLSFGVPELPNGIGGPNEIIPPLLNGDMFVTLPSGAPPTYSACSTNTVFANEYYVQTGLTFCVIEAATGKIAGVTVKSVKPSDYVELNITIWQHSS